MRRAALVVLALASIAGCSSTVLLGAVSGDMSGGPGSTDLARPSFDGFDGFNGGDGFDGSLSDLADGGVLVDLAH